MKIPVALFCLFVIVLCTGSCSDCKQNCTPNLWQDGFIFLNFTDSEATPLILKSYVQGSNFTQFIDSVVLSKPASWPDSNNTYSPAYLQLPTNSSTDYLVLLPNAGLSDSITGMSFLFQPCNFCPQKYNTPHLNNYDLNGTPQATNKYGDITIQR